MKYIAPLLLSLSLTMSLSIKAQQWELIWSDEFDGTELDTTNWTHDRGNGYTQGLWGWGNGELQYYQEENASVANGELTIQSREEPLGIADEYTNFVPYYYSSSKILTRDKFEFKYGKVEARIKTVDGQGMWPAFWMLPGGCWPETGEIDIMEQWGNDGNTNVTTGAAHLGNCGEGSTYAVNSQPISSGSYADDYHVYSVIWAENSIAWYVDDILFHSVTPQSYPANLNWPFNDNDWFLILNLAITSSGPNANTQFPNEIKVDYVRVYQDPLGIYDVTFKVDVSDLGLNPQDIVYLNGTFNNWCGNCAPMTDEGNDIWSITVPLSSGLYEYKFTVNGWESQEVFTGGEECTLTTGEFINRTVQVADNTVLPPVCWESCVPCNAFSDLTFQVDMNSYSEPFSLVNLSANFNGWCGECNPMTDPDGDGIYTTTVTLANGTYEYKFSLDNWAVAENFNPGDPCTFTTDIFTNRIVTVDSPATLPAVCWNSCSICPVVGCQIPHSLDVVEIGFGGSSPRVNGTWVNPEGTTYCEVRGGRISNSTVGTSQPEFANMNNTTIVDQTNGSTVNFNVVLYNNPNIPFTIGQTYGYEVRCECSDGSGLSDWSDISPGSTFTVPAAPGISSSVLLKNRLGSMDVTINPNPAQSSLEVILHDEIYGPITYSVMDNLGRTLRSETLQTSKMTWRPDIANLPSGLYHLNIQTKDRIETTRFLIVD